MNRFTTKPEPHLALRYRYSATCLGFLRDRISSMVHRTRSGHQPFRRLPVAMGQFLNRVNLNQWPDPAPILEDIESPLPNDQDPDQQGAAPPPVPAQ